LITKSRFFFACRAFWFSIEWSVKSTLYRCHQLVCKAVKHHLLSHFQHPPSARCHDCHLNLSPNIQFLSLQSLILHRALLPLIPSPPPASTAKRLSNTIKHHGKHSGWPSPACPLYDMNSPTIIMPTPITIASHMMASSSLPRIGMKSGIRSMGSCRYDQLQAAMAAPVTVIDFAA